MEEEIHQYVISNLVSVKIMKRITTAVLPFMSHSLDKLAHNKDKVLQLYNQQVQKLNSHKIENILQNERLTEKSWICWFCKEFTTISTNDIKKSPMQIFIPWRAVLNGNSMSTSCRLKFDASQSISSGASCNDRLEEGKRKLNKLVEISIKWYSH